MSAVVHVVAAGEIGGAERMLVDLARTEPSASAGARPRSIALFTPNDELRAILRAAGIPVDDRGPVREGALPFLASALGPSDVRWLAGVLARRRAAIVHLHTFASQVLGTRAAERVGARVVRTEHSTRVYDDPTCWPFARWSLGRADAVVCISGHVRGVALARAPFLARGDKVRVVHNGVDTRRFAPRARPERGARVRFVALGRLDPRKGLDLAIEAVARVPEAELEIVGDGEERASLTALTRRLGVEGRVRLTGYAGDVRDAIARADVALSSAREEGLGVALLEAMAMARPVVAVPVGGIPEIVRDGQTGWIAERRTTEDLARAMRAAIERPDERERRGDEARARVAASFSLDAMRSGYEDVYAGLA